MKFRDLMTALADRVGRQHLPVRDDVSDINEFQFLDEDAVLHDLAKRIVRDIYRANRCGFLDAEVKSTPTFDALGKIQGEVLRDEAADFDQVALLQNLADAAAKLLPPVPVVSPEDDDPDTTSQDTDDATGNNVRRLVRQSASR